MTDTQAAFPTWSVQPAPIIASENANSHFCLNMMAADLQLGGGAGRGLGGGAGRGLGGGGSSSIRGQLAAVIEDNSQHCRCVQANDDDEDDDR